MVRRFLNHDFSLSTTSLSTTVEAPPGTNSFWAGNIETQRAGARSNISRRSGSGQFTWLASNVAQALLTSSHQPFVWLALTGSYSAPQFTWATGDRLVIETIAMGASADFSVSLHETEQRNTAPVSGLWTFTYSARVTSVDGSSRLFRLRYGGGTAFVDGILFNQPPNAPTYTSPANNAGYTLNRRPQFRATVSDTDANSITSIELQVAGDTGFSSGLQTFTFSGSWASGATVALTPTADIPTGTRYARVRAFDGQEHGNYSSTLTINVADPTTVIPTLSGTISANDAGVLLSWLAEARTAIANTRAFRGISAPTWTDGTPTTATDIRAVHMTELRQRLQDALSTVGVTATWTDPTITAGVTDRKGQHWIEIRTELQKV